MSAHFPVKVQKRSLEYRRNGSDKEYHLVLITNGNENKAINIQRFGKRGTWGQMNAMVGVKSHHNNEFAKKYSEKTKKGYEATRESGVVECKDIWDLHAAIAGYWWKILPQLVDMFGSAQVDLVTRNSGGRPSDFAKSSEPVKFAEPPPVASEAERYAKNPLYGAF